MKRWCNAGMTALLLASAAGSQQPAPNDLEAEAREVAGRADLTVHRDVPYASDAPEFQVLDAYLVPSSRPAPVLVEIHGGGWRGGTKGQFGVYPGRLITRVIDAGISVVSVRYRLTPKHVWPAQAEDVARAVQLVRSKAREWNVDPARFAAIGGSAGGHLAMWLGYHDDLADRNDADPVRRLSTRLQAVVACWAPSDLTLLDPDAGGPRRAGATLALIGMPRSQFFSVKARELLVAASPVTHCSADDPPTLFVYGDGPDDPSGPHDPRIYDRAVGPHDVMGGLLVEEKLRRLGVPTARIFRTDFARRSDAYNAEVVAFLTRRLFPNAR